MSGPKLPIVAHGPPPASDFVRQRPGGSFRPVGASSDRIRTAGKDLRQPFPTGVSKVLWRGSVLFLPERHPAEITVDHPSDGAFGGPPSPGSAGFLLIGRRDAFVASSEIGGYWGHRWSHEIPFLWRFHAIHHSAEEIDWLVTVKAHPVDMFFTRLCATVPLYVLGLAQPLGNRIDIVPILVTFATTFWAYFIHANVSWRFGWLEWLISTPAFHHWHHTNDGPEVINKNYSAMLPLVDKCFGTFYLPPAWPAKYGSDTPIAPDLPGQLLDPISIKDYNPGLSESSGI